jgi:hypothetical protein
MSDRIEQSSAALVKAMVDLANEVDGVVDFGMTVCFMDEAKMAGRHGYITQRCDKIRSIVKSIGSCIRKLNVPNGEQLSLLHSQLTTNSDLFLNAYAHLEAFRRLGPESVRSTVDAVRLGWEAIHESIRELAGSAGVFDQAWYSPILERQQNYRNTVRQLPVWFQEAIVGSPASTNESPE